jgi:hypothetical protein
MIDSPRQPLRCRGLRVLGRGLRPGVGQHPMADKAAERAEKRRRRRRVCQPGGLFGLSPGRGPCRGPGRYACYMRVGDSQCLGRHVQTLRLPEPQLLHTPTRAAAGAATRAQTEQVSDLTHCAPPARSTEKIPAGSHSGPVGI